MHEFTQNMPVVHLNIPPSLLLNITVLYDFAFGFDCFLKIIYDQMDRIGQRDQVLEDEVKYRYNSVILHYRKSFIQDNAQRYLFCTDFVWMLS